MHTIPRKYEFRANACQPWGDADEYFTNEELSEMYGTNPQDEANAEQDACDRAIDEWPF